MTSLLPSFHHAEWPAFLVFLLFVLSITFGQKYLEYRKHKLVVGSLAIAWVLLNALAVFFGKPLNYGNPWDVYFLCLNALWVFMAFLSFYEAKSPPKQRHNKNAKHGWHLNKLLVFFKSSRHLECRSFF